MVKTAKVAFVMVFFNIVAKIKRYRDKMKTDTDIYEQM